MLRSASAILNGLLALLLLAAVAHATPLPLGTCAIMPLDPKDALVCIGLIQAANPDKDQSRKAPAITSVEKAYSDQAMGRKTPETIMAEGDRKSPSGGDRSPCDGCGTGTSTSTSQEPKSEPAVSSDGGVTLGGDATENHAPRGSYTGGIADAPTDKEGTGGGSDGGGDAHAGHDSGDGAAR